MHPQHIFFIKSNSYKMFNTYLVKRYLVFVSYILLALPFAIHAQDKHFEMRQPLSNEKEDHHCGIMKHHNQLMQTDAVYRANRKQIDQHAQNFVQNAVQNARKENAVGGVIVIPVVFHVVYRTAAENISDAQIKAQIKQLNDDYRRTNSDRTSTPSGFQSLVNDMEIQFALATRTPSGAATTGITRTSTTTTSFTDVTFDTQKPNTIWNRDQYLNLWSANLGTSLLGYAQFPGDVANTDGVVLAYETVGSLTKPGTDANFPYGRTASHEVGHWLNLYHIWGDDTGACTGSDQVADTPNQADETSGCGAYPQTDACTTTSPGVMYMNYMDYSYDNCLNMFTNGQKTRMIACLNGVRSSLLTSNGATPLVADYEVNANVGTQPTCAGASISYTILTTALNSYATNIALTTTDVPAGCTATLTSSNLTPGSSTTVNLSVGSGLAAGFYSFWIKTTSGASNTDSIALTFTVQAATLTGAPTIAKPTNASTGQTTTPLFTWSAIPNATAYDFQLSTTSNFSNIILTQNNLTTNSAFVPTASPLSNLTTYYWRVLAKNTCTSTAYTSGSFTTGTISCITVNSTNIPRTISATGTPLVTSTLAFPTVGTVTDVNVTNIAITHAYISDLTLTLRSPTSADVILWDQSCDAEDGISIGFDDQTTNAQGTFPCPPTNGLLYQPSNFLTAFNGIAAAGTWTLRVKDNYAGDGGSLTAWGLRICMNNAAIPVELVDFKARPLQNAVQLAWETATELNNAGFDLQRSTDPLSNFTKIGFIKGRGNSTEPVDYQFIDENVRLGRTYYYRLRQVDFDGKETLSKVVAANLDKDGVWDIALEPNPAEATLNVEILGKVNQTVSLDLYSIDGKLMLSKKMAATNVKTTLDLTPLSSGIYMLKCHAGANFFVKKVVKK